MMSSPKSLLGMNLFSYFWKSETWTAYLGLMTPMLLIVFESVSLIF